VLIQHVSIDKHIPLTADSLILNMNHYNSQHRHIIQIVSFILLIHTTHYSMVKIMLKRGKESDTYLAADSRHRRSPQIAMKVDKVCSFQPALWLSINFSKIKN